MVPYHLNCTQRGKILQSEIQLHQLFVCNYFTTCVCTLVSRLTICSKKKSIPLEISLHSLQDMSQLLLLGKVEYGGGPIFEVVLEC